VEVTLAVRAYAIHDPEGGGPRTAYSDEEVVGVAYYVHPSEHFLSGVLGAGASLGLV